MGALLTIIIGASANLAGAGNATRAAAPAAFGVIPASVPDWIQVALAIAGLVVGAVLIKSVVEFSQRFPKPEEHPKKDFARMLCNQIWTHTDTITDTFAQRMRLQPTAIEQLRVQVRNLREDLAGAVNFVEQMRSQPPQAWPKYDVFQAFGNWAGQIKAMESQLADLQQAITYPLIKEPVDKARDAMLVLHYITEQQILQRAIDRVRGHAFEVCAAAKPHLAKKKPKQDDEDDEHPACPCCRKHGDHIVMRIESPIQLPPAPPPPPPPPPPAPPPASTAAVCCCASPRICHCARCTCVCACPPAPAKAHA